MTGKDRCQDDDYVAKLLAEDAKRSSQRYAAIGLSALLPQRPSKGAPRPNTRFLSHIVREADSHNAALKKKEELEARIRLRETRHHKENTSREGEDRHDHKRRRTAADNRPHTRHRDSRERRSNDGKDKRHHKRDDRRRSKSPVDPTNSSNEHGEQHRLSRQRPDEVGEHTKSRRHRSHSSDQRPPRRHRYDRETAGPKRSSHTPITSKRSASPPLSHSDSESDPLEAMLGPKHPPKPTIRGRGATSSTFKSNIDTHFSNAYDPSIDVHPDSDQDDWDMALEALRDRQMWKQKQTERMREAGFGEDEIKKWERAGGNRLGNGDTNEGDVNDVRWKRKGEAREWDLGKESVT